jgi:multiple sugar transport system substrate-binding protein
MANAGLDSKATIERELENFHKLNPKIEVRYEIHSWSRAWSRLMQAVKEKSGPDVIQVGTTWIATLGYLGAVQKLDSRAVESDNFVPLMFSSCRCFKHLWAIPWFCEARVMFYRKDFLEKTEIDLADIDNWDAFKNACSHLTKLHTHSHAITPLGFSGHKEQSILQDFASWIWSFGGSFLSPDGKHCTISEEGTREGLTYFLDLISADYLSKSSLGLSVGNVAENFFFHDAYAFFFSNPWPLQIYLDQSSKYFIGRTKAKNFGMTLIPSGPFGKYNFAGGSALSVTSFSNHSEEAWTLVDYLTGRESMGHYCQAINTLPSRKDISISLNQVENTTDVLHRAVNDYGRSFPSHPVWGSIEQILVNGLSYSLRDYQSSQDQAAFLKNLAEISQEIELILSVFGE